MFNVYIACDPAAQSDPKHKSSHDLDQCDEDLYLYLY